MKRLIFPAALALALSGSMAYAQQPMHHHHPPSPERETARVSKQLNLTPDVSAKLEPIFADRDQKMQALMANDQLAPQDKHKQMHEIQKSTEQQLATVLTPDQLQQLKDMHKEHGHHGHPGGPEGPGGPPPSSDQAPPPPPPSAL
jgi:protein CpxP